jgi:alanine dehydrogenase
MIDESSKSAFSELVKQAGLQPREALAETKKPHQSLTIGVPKETILQEHRVALTPSSVNLLINNGNDVLIESGAGKFAHFSDKEYSEAGAKICYSKSEVYKSDVIVKVEPPEIEEIQMLSSNQLLISAIQLANKNNAYIKALMEKKLTAIAFEFLQSEDNIYPIVRSMSEIAGTSAISVASEYLSSNNGGKGEMLGGVTGIPPTEIVIIGAGTVGDGAVPAAESVLAVGGFWGGGLLVGFLVGAGVGAGEGAFVGAGEGAGVGGSVKSKEKGPPTPGIPLSWS